MRIVYEESGFPRELTEPDEWRRAIASNSLRPTTIVTVIRDGEPATILPAGEIDELFEVFSPAAAKIQPDFTPSVVAPLPSAPAPEHPAAALKQPAAVPEPAASSSRAEDFSPPGLNPSPEPSQPLTGVSQSGTKVAILIAAVVAALLILLIFINLPSSGGEDRGPDVALPPTDFVLNETSVEAGEAVAEGSAVRWTDTGTPKTYIAKGLELTLTAEKDSDGIALPVMTVRSPELGDRKLVGVPGGETAGATFIMLRPSRADRIPSVLLMTYSMGAHCCTTFKLLTPHGDSWTLVDMGSWDGEPLSSAPADVDGDGLLDFVMRDNAFLYAFASYADSWTPSLIYNVVNGKFVDRSSSPRFRSVHLADMVQSRVDCGRRNNGACAAYVASAARVGEAASALDFASTMFDSAATEGLLPTRCVARASDGSCPTGSEEQPAGFIQALDWFLQDHGYIDEPITPSSIETEDFSVPETPLPEGENSF